MQKLLLIITFIPLVVFPQQEKNHKISWHSNILYESNGLDKTFLNSFLYGGYITDKMKTNWIDNVDAPNIFFAELSNGFTYTNLHYNFSFSIADYNIINTAFSDDLLRFVLEGNYAYQNQTLDFSKTNLRIDRFQQYKLKYFRNLKQLDISAGLSFLNGNHHLSYTVDEGNLFTAPNGTALDINYDMNAFITDTSSFNPFINNGNGLAFDISSTLTTLSKDASISFSLTNLGFIMWNTKSILLATDSNFNFQGVEIDDIFSFNDSVLEENNIQDDIIHTTNNSFKSYIPATIHLSFTRKTKQNYFKIYTTGIILKWQPYGDNTLLSFSKIKQGIDESNYSPLYYIQSVVNTEHIQLHPRISYGGYSNDFNIGLSASRGKRNKLTIGTQHLEGLFDGDKTKALSMYLTFSTQF